MAFDRSGFCHLMNSGNQDSLTTAIDDIYDSPFIYDKSPSESHKSHQLHLFFENNTCGRIYIRDRQDFSNVWNDRTTFVISGSEPKIAIFKSIDIPVTSNVDQFQITTSAGTSDPWRLFRWDYFVRGHGIGKEN